MLNIETLIWVIPGLIGVWAYNIKLTVSLPQSEGWAYLLRVVFFAFPYYLFSRFPEEINDLFILVISSLGSGAMGYTEYLFSLYPEEINDLFVLVISSLGSGAMGYTLAHVINLKRSSPDAFHSSCTKWRESLIFVTLDSRRIYLGILMDHTRDIRFEYTIRIIPIYSGYRNKKGRVHWNFKYPTEEDSIVGLIISQSKIVTLCLWSDSDKFEDRPAESYRQPTITEKIID